MVVSDDAEIAASRLAIWFRLVLRRPQSEPWRLATASSPLVTGHIYRASLGTALKRLVARGVVGSSGVPSHFIDNPVEVLLNNGKRVNNGDLADIGVSFFWLATLMSNEEVAQALSEMPPRWVRGITQSGKELMLETSMAFIFSNIPKQEFRPLDDILDLPVLQWKDDVQEDKVWDDMAEVCADAVSTLYPSTTPPGEEVRDKKSVYETVKKGVLALRGATTEVYGQQGCIIGLTLLELIRASCRAGYMTEQVLGPNLFICEKGDNFCTKVGVLCKAEICTGLTSILTQIGQSDSWKIQRRLRDWKTKWGLDAEVTDVVHALQLHAQQEARTPIPLDNQPRSSSWLLGELNEPCPDPQQAFGALAKIGVQLAPSVLNMFEHYLANPRTIRIKRSSGDPSKFLGGWFEWKLKQAQDLGSGILGREFQLAMGIGKGPQATP